MTVIRVLFKTCHANYVQKSFYSYLILFFIAAVRPVVSQQPPQGYPAGVQQPIFYEPSLTSLQIRQANLEEMKKNDKYWEKRILELQKHHTKIQEIMECEYQKAVRILNVDIMQLIVSNAV